MPGPKHRMPPTAGDGLSIVTAVEPADDSSLEVPSTQGYVSSREVRTKTPDGVIVETEHYWTKRGLARWLAACPKVLVKVDLDQISGERDPARARPLPVYIDGFRIDVPKGTPQMVALPVAQIIWNMEAEFRTAQSRGIDLYRINPNDPTDHGLEIPALATG